MNDPIVSPWILYILSVLGPLKTIFEVTLVLSVFAVILAFLYREDAMDDANLYPNKEHYQKREKRAQRTFNSLLAIVIVSAIFTIFVPSSTTVIQMFIASKITPANLNTAADVGEKAANKAMQIGESAIDGLINKIIEAARKYDEMKRHEEMKHNAR